MTQSLSSVHKDREGYEFNLDNIEILDQTNMGHAREFSETWYSSDNSINRHRIGLCVHSDERETTQLTERTGLRPLMTNKSFIRICLQNWATQYSQLQPTAKRIKLLRSSVNVMRSRVKLRDQVEKRCTVFSLRSSKKFEVQDNGNRITGELRKLWACTDWWWSVNGLNARLSDQNPV